jgi:hypothetical protein
MHPCYKQIGRADTEGLEIFRLKSLKLMRTIYEGCRRPNQSMPKAEFKPSVLLVEDDAATRLG